MRMLRGLFLSLIILSFTRSVIVGRGPQWEERKITIYSDAESSRFGVARERRKLVEDIYNFQHGNTLPIQEEKGFLTAVTVRSEFKDELENLLRRYRSISVEGRHILRVIPKSRIYPIYVYREDEKGIRIGFSLEKPNQEVIDLIDNVYTSYPATAEIVKRYYRENYVIRILQADNFHSNQEPPSILDIMFSATLIGEENQQLYGVHDGLGYLDSLSEFIEKSEDYKILTDEYSSSFKLGGA